MTGTEVPPRTLTGGVVVRVRNGKKAGHTRISGTGGGGDGERRAVESASNGHAKISWKTS
jgi:hypothetical protein